MTVRELFKLCLKKMGVDDFSANELNTFDANQFEIYEKFLSSLNVVLSEIAIHYFHQFEKEQIVFDGKKFLFSKLSKRIVKVTGLDAGGSKLSYEVFPSGIESDFEGTATITYEFLPNEVGLESIIDDYRLTSNLLVDGVLSEIYFGDGVYDLASNYDSKFRKNLLRYKQSEKERFVKPRRWMI